MKIRFSGADRTVTGSSHLIILDDGFQILLDCGLFQGKQAYVDELNQKFAFAPKDVDALILSHAHIDHSGRIPKLVKEGFHGAIYCTPATLDLSRVMLLDSAHIQTRDSEFHNKRRKKRGLTELPQLYAPKDVEEALKLFQTVNYEEWFKIRDDVSFLFRDNGHILGSGSIT
ncbi:MAG: MBL fold metallo-hydrolase, partial [Chitinophagales bacterium]